MAENTDDTLLIKIVHLDNSVPEYSSTAYALINPTQLASAKFFKFDDSPKLLYELSCNGGFYISNVIDYLTLYSCYENKSYETVLQQVASETFSDADKLQLYKDYDEYKGIDDGLGVKFFLSEGKNIYKVIVWKCNIDFCVSSLYMEKPSQPIKSNDAAQIFKLSNIASISDSESELIENSLRKLSLAN